MVHFSVIEGPLPINSNNTHKGPTIYLSTNKRWDNYPPLGLSVWECTFLFCLKCMLMPSKGILLQKQ